MGEGRVVAENVEADRPGRTAERVAAGDVDAVDGHVARRDHYAAGDDRFRPARADAVDAVVGAEDGHALVDRDGLAERVRAQNGGVAVEGGGSRQGGADR